MYSTYKEGKSVVAERFIRILKNKIFMPTLSKNVYFDLLDDIVNKYNNTVRRTFKMKANDVYVILMLNTMKLLMKKIQNWWSCTKFKVQKYFC